MIIKIAIKTNHMLYNIYKAEVLWTKLKTSYQKEVNRLSTPGQACLPASMSSEVNKAMQKGVDSKKRILYIA